PAIRAWCDILKSGDIDLFRTHASAAYIQLRANLESLLVDVANHAAPLVKKQWNWQKRPDGSCYGDLVAIEFNEHHPKIRGQRGLSMARLEQLDGLRRLFLRYNRSLD